LRWAGFLRWKVAAMIRPTLAISTFAMAAALGCGGRSSQSNPSTSSGSSSGTTSSVPARAQAAAPAQGGLEPRSAMSATQQLGLAHARLFNRRPTTSRARSTWIAPSWAAT
jgi:hypothetical protein